MPNTTDNLWRKTHDTNRVTGPFHGFPPGQFWQVALPFTLDLFSGPTSPLDSLEKSALRTSQSRLNQGCGELDLVAE
jgi:hypothetical protein